MIIFFYVKKAVKSLSYEKEFKPICLVADAASAITNGFVEVFGECLKRVMCFAHMIRKVDDKLSCISDKEARQNIRNDIMHLQLARNESIFAKASSLFLLKSSTGGQEIENFTCIFTLNTLIP